MSMVATIDCELTPGVDRFNKQKRVLACAITGPDAKYRLARDFSLTRVTPVNETTYTALLPTSIAAVWEVTDWPSVGSVVAGERRRRYYVTGNGRTVQMNGPDEPEVLDAADDPEGWLSRRGAGVAVGVPHAVAAKHDPPDDLHAADEPAYSAAREAALRAVDAQMDALRSIHSDEGALDLEDALMALDKVRQALEASA